MSRPAVKPYHVVPASTLMKAKISTSAAPDESVGAVADAHWTAPGHVTALEPDPS